MDNNAEESLSPTTRHNQSSHSNSDGLPTLFTQNERQASTYSMPSNLADPGSSGNGTSQPRRVQSSLNSGRRLVMRERDHTERLDQYRVGGYHRVNIGDFYDGKYEIVKKLGWGGYSVVYMAYDYDSYSYVAMKFTKSDEGYTISSKREINFHDAIERADAVSNGGTHVTKMIDSFEINGANGTHIVLVFELLGPSLFQVLFHSNQPKFHLEKARELCRQLLQAVSFLHDECHIIHCDIKPENIMVQVSHEDIERLDPGSQAYIPDSTSYAIDFTNPMSDIHLKLGDFGCSTFDDKTPNRIIQTCYFRAPEVFLEAGFAKSADIWSVGVVAFEFITGTPLFTCKKSVDWTVEAMEHLSQIQEIFGPITRKDFQVERNEKVLNNYFVGSGLLRTDMKYNRNRLLEKLTCEQLSDEDDYWLAAHFLLSLLKTDPNERSSAKEALNHSFLLPYGGKGVRQEEPSGQDDDELDEVLTSFEHFKVGPRQS